MWQACGRATAEICKPRRLVLRVHQPASCCSMDESTNIPQAHKPSLERTPGPLRLLPIAIGVVLGIALSVYLVQRFYGDPTPPLTAEALKRAEVAWRKAGIRDYD